MLPHLSEDVTNAVSAIGRVPVLAPKELELNLKTLLQVNKRVFEVALRPIQ